MTREPTELLPCPFCGATAVHQNHGAGVSDYWSANSFVSCPACKATGPTGSQDHAVAGWNRRAALKAALSHTPEEVEASDEVKRCTICGFVVDTRYEATKPTVEFKMSGRTASPSHEQTREALSRPEPVAVTEEMQCERCQGNGEIVTDWDRYKHPRQGDVGDEAVAECPDCSGTGRLSASPSPPASERLVLTEPVTVTLEPRPDGGLRVSSKDLPGLILSGADAALVLPDIILAANELRKHRAGNTHGR